jgi:branched-subunit amino acid ABC-type transport system permease component
VGGLWDHKLGLWLLLNYEPFTLLVLTFGFDMLLSNLLNFFFKADVRSLTLESLSGSGFYLGEGWKVVISLVILVLFLLWRPQGVAGIKYA